MDKKWKNSFHIGLGCRFFPINDLKLPYDVRRNIIPHTLMAKQNLGFLWTHLVCRRYNTLMGKLELFSETDRRNIPCSFVSLRSFPWYSTCLLTRRQSWRSTTPFFYWRMRAIDPPHVFSSAIRFSINARTRQLSSSRIDDSVPCGRRKMIITASEGCVFCDGIFSTIWITEGFVLMTFLMC